MQFEFGNLSFETEQQSSVDAGRVINAIAVGDQAIVTTTEIKQLIPVRTVACQAGRVERQQDAGFAESDLRDEILITLTPLNRRTASSEIGINDLRMSFSCQPSVTPRSRSAYCMRWLSLFVMT